MTAPASIQAIVWKLEITSATNIDEKYRPSGCPEVTVGMPNRKASKMFNRAQAASEMLVRPSIRKAGDSELSKATLRGHTHKFFARAAPIVLGAENSQKTLVEPALDGPGGGTIAF